MDLILRARDRARRDALPALALFEAAIANPTDPYLETFAQIAACELWGFQVDLQA